MLAPTLGAGVGVGTVGEGEGGWGGGVGWGEGGSGAGVAKGEGDCTQVCTGVGWGGVGPGLGVGWVEGEGGMGWGIDVGEGRGVGCGVGGGCMAGAQTVCCRRQGKGVGRHDALRFRRCRAMHAATLWVLRPACRCAGRLTWGEGVMGEGWVEAGLVVADCTHTGHNSGTTHP